MSLRKSFGLAVLLAFLPAPALAQDLLADARRAGVVGERFDGYLGFAATPSAAVRKRALAVNIKRRALYSALSSRRNVTLQVAAAAAGCELLGRVQPGEAYLLPDGAWRRRGAVDPPPSASHCPKN